MDGSRSSSSNGTAGAGGRAAPQFASGLQTAPARVGRGAAHPHSCWSRPADPSGARQARCRPPACVCPALVTRRHRAVLGLIHRSPRPAHRADRDQQPHSAPATCLGHAVVVVHHGEQDQGVHNDRLGSHLPTALLSTRSQHQGASLCVRKRAGPRALLQERAACACARGVGCEGRQRVTARRPDQASRERPACSPCATRWSLGPWLAAAGA